MKPNGETHGEALASASATAYETERERDEGLWLGWASWIGLWLVGRVGLWLWLGDVCDGSRCCLLAASKDTAMIEWGIRIAHRSTLVWQFHFHLYSSLLAG